MSDRLTLGGVLYPGCGGSRKQSLMKPISLTPFKQSMGYFKQKSLILWGVYFKFYSCYPLEKILLNLGF